MTERTIVLRILDEFHKGSVNANANEVFRAIGYLSHWCMNGQFPKVVIMGDREGNIFADYYKADGSIGYQIGGILGGDGKYSFHS